MDTGGFKSHQVDDYVTSFKENGYVVIEDVLNSDEIKRSVNEIWEYIEENGNVKRDDPSSWGNENWPSKICKNGGFMGAFPYWKRMKKLDSTWVNRQPQAWRNRENPLVYQAFSKILQSTELWVSIDRYGVMRPARVRGRADINASMPEDAFKDNWQTKKDWLHWDLNPFHLGTSAAGFGPRPLSLREKEEYGSIRVQGLLTLSDCPEGNGGFHCVPKFTDGTFFNWASSHRNTYGSLSSVASRNFVEVPDDDDMRENIRRVPMKAGSLLVWNSQLPHGNFPNTGFDFRMVQYIKMIPVRDPREFMPAMNARQCREDEWFPEGYRPSELGQKLLGLREWDNTNQKI
ncbi:unnamed protein product [Albugo candida]|uniref:Phytanoyl-CoA dioxygenase n=1 Tax=Albugo candida TaxID=65357 RepID=A0A024GJM8_9STRA|nr:unnamed protein product [Albugo candida]|eukprot:CCI46534.1 unnamed protein product [Albugo candida]